MSFYRRPVAENAAGRSGQAAVDADMATDAPALHEYMTLTTLPDGTTRKTSSLVVFAEDGCFKVCLTERDVGMSLWASGSTLWDALRALDGLLQADRPPWRAQRSQGPHKGRK